MDPIERKAVKLLALTQRLLGDMIAETERFPRAAIMAEADIDLGRLRQERARMNSFGDCAHEALGKAPQYRTASFELQAPSGPVAAGGA